MVVMPEPNAETLDVLFIADDPDIAEMYRMKLELDGYWVRVVSADRAVVEARGRRPDLVFLDLPAAGLDGLRVLANVRDATHRPDLPAIILAPAYAQDLAKRGAPLGATDYVVRISAPASPSIGQSAAL
jgi:DNA-binding response OmpR family regulator